jgi:serine/threonine-protein kinase SRK2
MFALYASYLCRWFLQQLVLTMEYFHRRNIAHRDIKLENTLLKVRFIELFKTLCDLVWSTATFY